MTPYYDEAGITIYHGDCREVLPGLGPCTSCVSDPPYGLGFMGQGWDHGVPGMEFWKLVRDALLPGAMCLLFGGTRTYHRLTCAVEDAGLEIRDCLMWLYGQGFPKSLDISKAIDKATGAKREVVGKIPNPASTKPRHSMCDSWQESPDITVAATDDARQWKGWGTALKPAWEPILLAMNQLDGTFAENAIKHGVAGLNVDGTRIGMGDDYDSTKTQRGHKKHDGRVSDFGSDGKIGKEIPTYNAIGRWPANVVHDGSDEVVGMFPEAGGQKSRASVKGRRPGGFVGTGADKGAGGPNGDVHLDSGSAARFFYSPKACGTDRGNKPEYDMPLFGEVESEVRNTHPTVKPTSVMHWLLRLVSTPTGGVILDPFMGSGTTLVAARDVGCRAIGIEIEERYCEIAAKRLAQGVSIVDEVSKE